ncbi:MAG: hypothetical protein ACJ8H8_30805 [Geminicoccaceae bacterium]
METRTRTAEGRLAAVWQVDLAVALALAAIGGVVVMDSLQVGIGWGVEGPEAGFFPFFVGLLLLAGASFTAARNLLAARRDLDVFVEAAGASGACWRCSCPRSSTSPRSAGWGSILPRRC